MTQSTIHSTFLRLITKGRRCKLFCSHVKYTKPLQQNHLLLIQELCMLLQLNLKKKKIVIVFINTHNNKMKYGLDCMVWMRLKSESWPGFFPLHTRTMGEDSMNHSLLALLKEFFFSFLSGDQLTHTNSTLFRSWVSPQWLSKLRKPHYPASN